MRHPTLLVCLTPTISPQSVNELTFYQVVNPIAPVMNLKMVSTEGQIKAFVQVSDEAAADSVITAINGKKTSIGKFKAFLSVKKFVNYEKSLVQILTEVQDNVTLEKGTENNNTDNKRQNTVSSSRELLNEFGFRNCTSNYLKGKTEVKKEELDLGYNSKISINSNQRQNTDNKNQNAIKKSTSNKTPTDSLEQTPKTCIDDLTENQLSITAGDPLALKSKLINEIFGKFGAIVKKKLDSKNCIWTLIYESKDAVSKAKQYLADSNCMSYQLVEPIPANKHSDKSSYSNQQKNELEGFQSTSSNSKRMMIVEAENSNLLKIVDSSQKLVIEDLCRILAVECMPLQLTEAFDVNDEYNFFIARFESYDEALEVYKFVKSQALGTSPLKITFADIQSFN